MFPIRISRLFLSLYLNFIPYAIFSGNNNLPCSALFKAYLTFAFADTNSQYFFCRNTAFCFTDLQPFRDCRLIANLSASFIKKGNYLFYSPMRMKYKIILPDDSKRSRSNNQSRFGCRIQYCRRRRKTFGC